MLSVFKKYVIVVSIAVCGISFMPTLNAYNPQTASHANRVWICVTGEVYHYSRGCHGLKNAKHKIIEVSISEATGKYKRRPCNICAL